MALLGNLTGSSQFFNTTEFYNGVATQSLRLDHASDTKLTRTPDAGNRKTNTLSLWFKRSTLDGNQHIARFTGGGNSDTGYLDIYLDSSTKRLFVAGWSTYFRTTNRLFRDVSSWYHVVVAVDTTDSTADNRIKIYVNGVQETSFATNNAIGEDADTGINANGLHTLGDGYGGFNGYFAEVNFIEGSQLTPSSFGETKNGVWIPKKYTGSYGTNGYRLQFDQVGVGTASTSTIGADTSGNNNHYTSTNIVASDCAMPDSPENNFATLNPIYETKNNQPTFSEGNLKVTPSQVAYQNTFSTMGVSSGKWYAEILVKGTANSANYFGIADIVGIDYLQNTSTVIGYSSSSYGIRMLSGAKYNNDSLVSYGSQVTNDQVFNIALDMDNGKVWFGSEGTYFNSGNPAGNSGEAYDNLAGTFFIGMTQYTNGFTSSTINFGQDSTFAGDETATSNADENGIGAFHHAPPSGFLALCSANLPEPTISPNAATQADDYFETVLYEGDGSTQDIAVNFKPDWTWIKNRDAADSHQLFDSNRGATKALESNENIAEATNDDTLTAFISSGFSLGDDVTVNTNNESYVAWNWKANGGTATATISESGNNPAASVQANPTAGFSIITYTGTGATGTIAHGLDTAPKMMIIKNRDATDAWQVFHSEKGNTHAFYLNLAQTPDDNTSFWNDTSPTSSVFTINTDHGVNADGEKYVAYVFSEIESYSRFGSYTGNGSTDGTFVFTGFKPAWVMVKRTDSANNWVINDSTRTPSNEITGSSSTLYADVDGHEGNYDTNVDFLSNGFKARTTGGHRNASGGTYIYMAFAEAPFKYANAR